MNPLEGIDETLTRKEVRKHLMCLNKRIFRTEILDYMSLSTSITSMPGKSSHSSSTNKIMKASNRCRNHNEEISNYLEWVFSGINRLEPEQRKIILGKYLYDYDEEEFEEQMKYTMRTIYRKLKESEIDLAIILGCVVYKSKNQRKDL